MTAPDAAGPESTPGPGQEPVGGDGPRARPRTAKAGGATRRSGSRAVQAENETGDASGRPVRAAGGVRGLAVRDVDALIFAADMYALPLDQLAVLTGGERSARAAAVRWRELGYAEMARLTAGPAWVWVTRAGLEACGLRYRAATPALSRLAHIRAVAATRIALEATGGYRRGAAYWRCERRIRARHGVGIRQHLPDAEVHWPDSPAAVAAGAAGWEPVAWAGECWAVEAELSPKTVARTGAIMREILSRTGDYGCPAAEASVPGQPPRHARVLYVCSPAALGTVLRARDGLGPLGARVEVRDLPSGALLP
jgi:hypothetical protein